MNDLNKPSHTTRNCKYHVVFAPKYRRKVFYAQKRYDIGKILRELCKWKQINIIEAEVCPDHVHNAENECVIVYGISERQRYTNGGATSNTSIATGSSGAKAVTWTQRGKMRI